MLVQEGWRRKKEEIKKYLPNIKVEIIGRSKDRRNYKVNFGKINKSLKGKARVKRAMWSRRAKEYEDKIYSGDLLSIAEVVRDLHRGEDKEQSYSERQLYEAALERLTREMAIVDGLEEQIAQEKVDEVLGGRAA